MVHFTVVLPWSYAQCLAVVHYIVEASLLCLARVRFVVETSRLRLATTHYKVETSLLCRKEGNIGLYVHRNH